MKLLLLSLLVPWTIATSTIAMATLVMMLSSKDQLALFNREDLLQVCKLAGWLAGFSWVITLLVLAFS